MRIDVGRAQSSLENLRLAVTNLDRALTAAQSSGGSSFAKLSSIISNSGAAGAVNQLATALNGLNTNKVDQTRAVFEQVRAAAVAAAGGAKQFGESVNSLNGGAEVVNRLRQSFADAKAAAADAAQAGNRLAATIRAQMQQAKQSTENALTPLNALKAAFANVSSGIAAATGQFGQLGVAVNAGVNAFQSLRQQGFPPGIALGAAAATAALTALTATLPGLIRDIISVNNVFTSFKNTLEGLRGAGEGTRALNDLRGIAARTATDINSLTKNYQRFAAAAAQSNFTVTQTNKIFEDIAGSARILNLDAVKTERVFNALTQIVSKGKVQMEELRQQLGDSLPGAFAAMAAAANTTTDNLAKMIQNGQVGADVLPAFAAALFETVGGADRLSKALLTLQAQTVLFSNAITDLSLAFGEGLNVGFMQQLAQGLQAVNNALSAPGFELFARALGDVAGILGGTLLSALSGALFALNAFAGAIGATYAALTLIPRIIANGIDALGRLIGVTDLTAKSFSVLVSTLAAFATGAAIISGVRAIGVAMGLLSASTTTATVAVTGLRTALAFLTGPIGLAVAGATALLGVLYQFPKTREFMKSAADGAKELYNVLVNGAAAADKTQAAIKGLGFTYKELETAASKVVNSVSLQAEALNKLKTGMDGTKAATDGFKQSMVELQNQQRSAAAASADLSSKIARARDDNNSIVNSIQAQINSVQRQKQEMKEAGLSADLYSEDLRHLQQELREARNTNSDIIGSMTRQKTALDESRAATQAQIAKLKEAKAVIQEFGAALSGAEQIIARQAIAYGLQKQAAVQLAQALTVAKNSSLDLAKAVAAENPALEKQAEFYRKNLELVNQEVEALRKKRNEQKFLNAGDEARLNALSSTSSKLTEYLAKVNLTKAANDAFNISTQQNIKLSEAVKQVWQGLSDAAQKRIGSEQKLQDAISKKAAEDAAAANSTNKLKGATDKAADAADQAAKKLADIKDTLNTIGQSSGPATQGIGEFAGQMKSSADQVQRSSSIFSTLADAFSSLSTTSGNTTGNIVGLEAALQRAQTVAAPFAEALPVASKAMTDFSTATAPAATGLDQISTSLPVITTAVSGLNEVLPPLTAGMSTLGDTLVKFQGGAASIDAVTAAAVKVKPEIEGLAAGFDLAKTSVSMAAAEMSTKFAPAFEKGMAAAASAMTTGVDSMVSDLARLIDRTDAAIAKLRELAAAKSASNSGGGGDTGDASSRRFGGYSDRGGESQSVSASVFNNAPALRDGIANTNSLQKKVAGGGIPTILHPNEAVVPLPKGRSIPVELKGGANDQMQAKLLSSLDSLSRSTAQLQESFSATQMKTVSQSEAKQNAFAQTDQIARKKTEDTGSDTKRSGNVTVNINITATDVDSFRRSEPQLRARMYKALKEADRRNG